MKREFEDTGSAYGDSITYHWKGPTPLRAVHLIKRNSRHPIPQNDQDKIKQNWSNHLKEHPGSTNDNRIGFESVFQHPAGIGIITKPTTYDVHIYRLQQQDIELPFYHNLMGVTALQESTDGKIIAAVKTGPHHQHIVALGSGYIDPHETLIDTVTRECNEETSYDGFDSINEESVKDHVAALAVSSGSEKTTGIIAHLRLPIPSSKVHLNPDNHEHTRKILLPTDPESLEIILREKQFEDMPLSDQLIAVGEMYLKNLLDQK